MRMSNLAIVVSLCVSAARLGAATYTVKTLTLSGATQLYAQAVNTAGEVAGFYTDNTGTSHGFTWTAGTFTTINIAGSSGTWITGINDDGVICGYFHKTSSSSSGITLGFQQTGTTVVSNHGGLFRPQRECAGHFSRWD
jgi:hypothetical protein